MLIVALAEALRQETLDRASEQLFALVVEEPLGLLVHQDDLTPLVDHHQSVRGGVQQLAQLD